MDGYVTPPQFPINPVYVHPQMGAGLQHLFNQLQALAGPPGPEVPDYTAIPRASPRGPLNEDALLRLDRIFE